jgi:hypothetical protein
MHRVMPRSFRPRLLLLPLALGVLVAPAFLATSATPRPEHDLRAGTLCKNAVLPARKLETPRAAPTCVNCRAPLLNAPLARTDRRTTGSAAGNVDPSPAA